MSLNAECRIEVITREAFVEALKYYPQVVPSRAYDYEDLRYATIPQAVTARKEKGQLHLGKSELASLVDWKLSHGTFRPKLKQLVQSNPPDTVQKTTATAFSSFDGTLEKLKASLKQLSTLKGIGPATASLLLSVAFPSTVPFFSDELFRWTFWEEGKGKGWDRPIKYTPKEYHELFSRIQEIRNRHDWDAVDMEKVAFVLGHRASGEGTSRPEEEERSKQTAGAAKDKAKALEKISEKRGGLDLDESPPPTKKLKKEHENAEPPQAEEPVKKKASTAKTPKPPTIGTRSSSRLQKKG